MFRGQSDSAAEWRVVKTGARAAALVNLLVRLGYKPTAARAGPRSADLSPAMRNELMELYRTLGGTSAVPTLRPGAWDLAFEGGLLVELDEELHFNRYRYVTLEPEWTIGLPWRTDYRTFATDHERDCMAAARWGKRWTNPSCESMFGTADPPGVFETVGAPRWKQRALYDATRDAAAVDCGDITVARLATVDVVGGVRLDTALEQGLNVDLDALRELLARRSTRQA